MNAATLSRVGGILMLGVFLVNVYLGLYDTNLSKFNPLHYELNWVIAVATLVAAALLLAMPASRLSVLLAGVLWPLIYIASLMVDVSTQLCSGAPASSCWPSTSAAFDYLILNQASIPGADGYGWMLAPVIPIAIVLLVVVLLLSLASILMARKI